MKVIIDGDEEKLRDNIAEAMFNIVLERFKKGNLNEFKKDKPIKKNE